MNIFLERSLILWVTSLAYLIILFFIVDSYDAKGFAILFIVFYILALISILAKHETLAPILMSLPLTMMVIWLFLIVSNYFTDSGKINYLYLFSYFGLAILGFISIVNFKKIFDPSIRLNKKDGKKLLAHFVLVILAIILGIPLGIMVGRILDNVIGLPDLDFGFFGIFFIILPTVFVAWLTLRYITNRLFKTDL